MQDQSTFQVYNASAGSGKTFTLVKEFLKIVLSSGDASRFQQILAVTFTNKAAAEMKERVLLTLREFSKEKILKDKTPMFLSLESELMIDDELLQKRSRSVLHRILQNYGAFNITTIDSFTHRLIRSFAFDLGLSLNFEVEMDAKSLLNEAVDALISKIGEEKELTQVLIDFSIQKINEDKSWDISYELKDMALLLLKENNIEQLEKLQNRPIQDFLDLKVELQKQQALIEKQFSEIAKKALALIDAEQVGYDKFSNSGELPKHFIKLKEGRISDLIFEGRLQKNIEKNHHFQAAKASHEDKLGIENILEALIKLYEDSKQVYIQHFERYIFNKLILSNLIPLAVLNSINKALTQIKEEQNLRLNAEFNQIISKNLQEQPAAFIYERIGEKFKYYFIDEMQDTSILQWQNLIPLISNALSQEQTSLLLVGDVKQAIYRWRGSEPQQFLKLAQAGETKAHNPFTINKTLASLTVNYRSYDNIISFNNSLFQHIASFFKKPLYAQIYKAENQQKMTSKVGGYVQLSFIENGLVGEEKNMAYGQKVLDLVYNITKNFAKNEICILCRTRKKGIFLAEFLSSKGIEVISTETLLLQSSPKILFLIDLLNYIHNDQNKQAKLNLLYYLYQGLKVKTDKHQYIFKHLNLALDTMFKDQYHFDRIAFLELSLYEGVEYIIRAFDLSDKADAYLQYFLDEVLNFSQKKSSDLNTFLLYWEEKKDQLSIVVPEQKDAVRIMTIHKAKGLEFPVVIFPFDLEIYGDKNPKIWYDLSSSDQMQNFSSLLIGVNKDLEASGSQGASLYQAYQDELELDSINLLYVTLTRAIEQIYIVAEIKTIGRSIRSSSQLFIDYLMSKNLWNETQKDYTFGTEIRNLPRSKASLKSKELERFISSSWQSHNINIVSNSALIWDERSGTSILYGNLIHEILAQIRTPDDIEGLVNQYVLDGTMDLEQQIMIKKLLFMVVEHPLLKNYFTQNIEVFNEREILGANSKIFIPDRLVIDADKRAVIIDYKTGKPSSAYHQQLIEYGQTVQELGYTVKSLLLVYISDKLIVEEVKPGV